MLPPDLLAALGGGGGAPGPQGPLPPDMMAALGGPDSAPEEQAEPAGPDGNASASEHLKVALDHLGQAMAAEPDEVDKASIATCIAQLQKVLAKDQQEQDGLMQGKISPSAIRSASGGTA